MLYELDRARTQILRTPERVVSQEQRRWQRRVGGRGRSTTKNYVEVAYVGLLAMQEEAKPDPPCPN